MTLWDWGPNCHKPQAMPVGKKIFSATTPMWYQITISLGTASGKIINEIKHADKYSKKQRKKTIVSLGKSPFSRY